MAVLARSVPQIPVVLVSLLLWGSFAWALPAEAPAAEGDAEVAPEDPWAGVKISDAYDKLRCPYCWDYNELTAARCRSCGREFPQPSGEYTYPPWVFVPGKGYYEEGTLLEPGKSRKGLWITGLVLIPVGLIAFSAAGGFTYEDGYGTNLTYRGFAVFYGGLGAMAVGGVLLIIALTTRKEPVYAFDGGEPYEPLNGRTYARRSPDSDGATLKVEVTVLGF
jgi:hypothetical protein